MVAKYALPWASRQLVSIHCFIQGKIFCNREAERLKPLVLKNLRSHKERNIKTGSMFITTVLFTMFLNSLALQISEMVLSSISRVLGSDLSVSLPLKRSENEAAVAAHAGQRGSYQGVEGLREAQITAFLED